MPYLLYPYNSSESATVMNEPIAKVEQIPTEITIELMRTLAIRMIGEDDTRKEETTDKINLAADMREIATIMMLDLTVTFDRMAVVEEVVGIQHELYKLGEELHESMGDDSACYEAAENWQWILEEKACHILELVEPDWEA